MPKKYKLAILIGRFQPAHNGHLANFLQANEIADEIHILLGSAYQPRTIENPFTWTERKEIITTLLKDKVPSLSISPIRDYKYSNNSWIQQVQELILAEHPLLADNEICIVGYDKDDSSWYNHAFPQWDFVSLKGYVHYGTHPIDATKVRELYFEGHTDFVQGSLHSSVFEYLVNFTKTPHYKYLVEEYIDDRDMKKKWAFAPYKVSFNTVDAVVVQGGHVLMVRRGRAPGKGLWALPGGFLEFSETWEEGVLRELIEETKIKVPEIVLRKGITYEKGFDHPKRSIRGRTLTQAFLIELDGGDGKLPRVKGSDDADKAQWFTLAEISTMVSRARN
jgi:bifunctional NMN adenylyltransferase/nudix hydrolase